MNYLPKIFLQVYTFQILEPNVPNIRNISTDEKKIHASFPYFPTIFDHLEFKAFRKE